jgi:hypothetical protein
MVGFLGALAGGAASGWSKGQLESIKAKREEKLKMLDMEFQRSENALTRGIQEKQIASQEKLTMSSQALQERLGNLQAETTKEVAKLGATVDRERIGSSEKISQAQIDANKLMTEMQINAANTPTLIQTKTGFAWQRKDGTMMPAPLDPATGKPLDPLATKDDTPEIANFKYLSALPGMTPERAMKLSFESDDNSEDDMYKNFYEANLKAEMGDFSAGNPTPEQQANVDKRTQLSMENWRRSKTATPAAGSPAAEEPAVPSSAGEVGEEPTTTPESTKAPDVKFPEGTTEEQAVAWAKAQIKAGKSRQAVKEVLKANKVDPSLAGL